MPTKVCTTVVVLLTLGCSLAPSGYAVRRAWLHKDVLQVTVYLDRALEPDAYLRIVDDEVETIESAEHVSATGAAVPIYQIRFDFVLSSPSAQEPPAVRRLASVTVDPTMPKGNRALVDEP